jgi:hypothetical protein
MNILAQTRIVSSLHRYVTAALSLASIAPAAAAGSAPARSPNFVFIIADDLGYGDIGCYGQTEIKTPHIDRLARQGVRFTQFYTGAPVCAPARNTLLTGEHAGHALLRANGKIDLRPQDTTIAEILHDAAYVNGMAGKWGLGMETGSGEGNGAGFTRRPRFRPLLRLHRPDNGAQLLSDLPGAGPNARAAAQRGAESRTV